MGQPVTLIRTVSPRPGVVRFELNRSLTGMGHERYTSDDEITSDRPADRLARRLFEAGGVSTVHMYGSMVTVEMAETDPGDTDSDSTSVGGDLEAVVRSLYTYYVPGVKIPSDEELAALVDG